MMSDICKQLVDEDPEFRDFKADFNCCYACLKFPMDDVKRDIEKAQKELQGNKTKFELILKVDPDVEDSIYGKQISKFLRDSEPKVN
jgi:hypothetical protein